MNQIPRQLELGLCGGVTVVSRPVDTRRLAGIKRCQSPLETSLAMAFSRLPGFQWRLPFADDVEVGRWPKAGVLLLAQEHVGPYWADFCICGWRGSRERRPILVEVDGHEYHERTPLQAQRDRSRDRYLIKRGATVLRFTGREVWQDAWRCAWEVWGFAAART